MSSAAGTEILQNDGSVTLVSDGSILLSDGASDCDCCPSNPPCLNVSSMDGDTASSYIFALPSTLTLGGVNCSMPSCSPTDSTLTLTLASPNFWTFSGSKCVGGVTGTTATPVQATLNLTVNDSGCAVYNLDVYFYDMGAPDHCSVAVRWQKFPFTIHEPAAGSYKLEHIRNGCTQDYCTGSSATGTVTLSP